jgi:hypothetical protein
MCLGYKLHDLPGCCQVRQCLLASCNHTVVAKWHSASTVAAVSGIHLIIQLDQLCMVLSLVGLVMYGPALMERWQLAMAGTA